MLLFGVHLFYIFHCLEMSLFHVYFSNDVFLLMCAVSIMDQNAKILRDIGHLREIGVAWRGGDEFHHSLEASLDSIVDVVSRSNDVLYNIALYRERKQQEYVDGLSYNDVKNLKITKEHIYSLFRAHRTNVILETKRAHISIEWCISQPIRYHWMDRWYMVFKIPPHNNK